MTKRPISDAYAQIGFSRMPLALIRRLNRKHGIHLRRGDTWISGALAVDQKAPTQRTRKALREILVGIGAEIEY